MNPSEFRVPPSGGSLEIGNLPTITFSTVSAIVGSSPFGGIPRNWKQENPGCWWGEVIVPPSGGSLEIGNMIFCARSLGVTRWFPLRGDP